jgi:molecular chaperone GrpE
MAERKKSAKGAAQHEPVAEELRTSATEAEAPAEADTPIETAAEVVEQGGDLVRVTAERDEYLDHLRRLQAEFDNYRKRVQRENEDLRLRAAEAVVESLLPVVDNLGRALQAADRHEEGQLIAGVRLVADQLRGTLAGHGLDELDVQSGVAFDPSVHEAVLTQESEDQEEGTVLQVVERGYLLHGRLLRPAKVIVAR